MADGFVIGQPGYANLDDFLEALDRTIPGTGEWTTPAYLFGRPDSDWVDSNSFLMVTTDAGGNTDVLFLNRSDVETGDQLPPSTEYLIDSNDDGTPDSLSQQFYYDQALGVLQNLNWFSIAMPFASVSTDGFQIVTSAVYAQFGPDKWVAGIRTQVSAQFDFVVDDLELPELGEVALPLQAAALHPVAYVTDKAAAVSWAQLLAGELPFLGTTLQMQTVNIGEWGEIRVLTTAGAETEEVFVELEAASVEEYRNAIVPGAGIASESITTEGYTIIDGNGERHYLRSMDSASCGEDCEFERNKAFIEARIAYTSDMQGCMNSFLTGLAGAGAAAAVCCKGVARVSGPLAIEGCALGAVICGIGGLVLALVGKKSCENTAYSIMQYRLELARLQWQNCCAHCDEDDPACHPAF